MKIIALKSNKQRILLVYKLLKKERMHSNKKNKNKNVNNKKERKTKQQ